MTLRYKRYKSHIDDPLTFQDGGELLYRVGDYLNTTAHTARCQTLDPGPVCTRRGECASIHHNFPGAFLRGRSRLQPDAADERHELRLGVHVAEGEPVKKGMQI